MFLFVSRLLGEEEEEEEKNGKFDISTAKPKLRIKNV